MKIKKNICDMKRLTKVIEINIIAYKSVYNGNKLLASGSGGIFKGGRFISCCIDGHY